MTYTSGTKHLGISSGVYQCYRMVQNGYWSPITYLIYLVIQKIFNPTYGMTDIIPIWNWIVRRFRIQFTDIIITKLISCLMEYDTFRTHLDTTTKNTSENDTMKIITFMCHQHNLCFNQNIIPLCLLKYITMALHANVFSLFQKS